MFPEAPPRPSRPEANGLRHLAFATPDINAALRHLAQHAAACEPMRVNPFTGKRFTIFRDPYNLAPGIYETDASDRV
ncbi:MAG: VOC family protein [Pseudomonadota bacterium]